MAKFRKSTASKSVSGPSAYKKFKPVDLTTQTQTAVGSTTRISAAADLRKLSGDSVLVPKNIQFGSPSNAGTKSHSSTSAGNEWKNLLKTASSGVSSVIGGGFLESGISSLVSGLTSLFDGGNAKNEAPLVRFTLPESQQQTMYITSEGLSKTASSEGISASSINTGSLQNLKSGAVYQGTPLQGPVYRQSEIVQAVKHALLTSSSLNDVIAEI
jgi:hypothetical protein